MSHLLRLRHTPHRRPPPVIASHLILLRLDDPRVSIFDAGGGGGGFVEGSLHGGVQGVRGRRLPVLVLGVRLCADAGVDRPELLRDDATPSRCAWSRPANVSAWCVFSDMSCLCNASRAPP